MLPCTVIPGRRNNRNNEINVLNMSHQQKLMQLLRTAYNHQYIYIYASEKVLERHRLKSACLSCMLNNQLRTKRCSLRPAKFLHKDFVRIIGRSKRIAIYCALLIILSSVYPSAGVCVSVLSPAAVSLSHDYTHYDGLIKWSAGLVAYQCSLYVYNIDTLSSLP